jgi:hypothetical protein
MDFTNTHTEPTAAEIREEFERTDEEQEFFRGMDLLSPNNLEPIPDWNVATREATTRDQLDHIAPSTRAVFKLYVYHVNLFILGAGTHTLRF